MDVQPEFRGEGVSIESIECVDHFVWNLADESQVDTNKNSLSDGVLASNCHRMSPASGEALLKLLEEPPPRVRFVLCTTEPRQIKGTILSRCQQHEFKSIYWREIAQHLENVAKQERVKIAQEAVHLCSKLSNGSMRNGLQNLEKLMDFAGGEDITGEMAQKAFGSVSDVAFFDLMDEIIKEDKAPDATKGYKLINNLLISGMGFSQICEGISENLRNILIGISSTSCVELISVSEEGKKRLIEQLKLCKPKIKAVMEVSKNLVEARAAVEFGLSPDAALQMWFLDGILAFRK